MPPPLSPAAALRLVAHPGPETDGPPTTPTTSTIDPVIVTPSVGDGVLVITGRFGSGRRPIELRVERGVFTDEELASLIAWTRRTVRRKDPARRRTLRAV